MKKKKEGKMKTEIVIMCIDVIALDKRGDSAPPLSPPSSPLSRAGWAALGWAVSVGSQRERERETPSRIVFPCR